MYKKDRIFHIIDIDCDIIVEGTTKKKDIFDMMDDYIENFQYDWFNPCDDSFSILYKDGSFDCIDECYDGHKVKKQGIISIVHSNPETYFVYGNFEINEYGVVTVSKEMIIANENIIEKTA